MLGNGWSANYYPYGEIASQSGSSAETRFDFTGHERDQGTGLVYAGARFYHDAWGRWLSVDALADRSPSLTPYHYVRNNPIIFFDPSGLSEFTFHIRAFAPPGAFKGFGFHDDDRGFTTALDVTSRIKQTFTIDAIAQTFSFDDPVSDPTIRTSGASKTGSPEGKAAAKFSGGGQASITQEFEGSNPFYFGLAPDIEVKTGFSIIENTEAGTLTIQAVGSSKRFPATEAFVVDTKGNSVFLGVGAAYGDPSDLIFAGQKKIFKNTIIINIDKNGIFQNVQFRGRTYSLEEFNKQFSNQDAGPHERN